MMRQFYLNTHHWQLDCLKLFLSGVCSFKMPEGMQLENLVDLQKKQPNSGNEDSQSGSQIAATFISHIDPSLTWEFIRWVRSVTKIPVWVKVKSRQSRIHCDTKQSTEATRTLSILVCPFQSHVGVLLMKGCH